MSAILLPLGATVAAGALTYWCCVRPMRRGREQNPDSAAHDTSHAFEEQLARARAELDQLRASRTVSPSATPSAPARPHR